MLTFGPAVPIGRMSEALAAWIATNFPAAAVQAKIRLFKNNFTVSDTAALADFTEADFDGYGAINVADGSTWTGPIIDPDGNLKSVSPTNYTFIENDPETTPNTVYGYYITDSTGVLLIAAQNFPAPLDFTLGGAQVTIELAMQMIFGGMLPGSDSEYGSVP